MDDESILHATEGTVREVLGEAEYARLQQQRFFQELFARPTLQRRLQHVVIRYLRNTCDPQLIRVASAIARGEVDPLRAFAGEEPDGVDALPKPRAPASPACFGARRTNGRPV